MQKQVRIACTTDFSEQVFAIEVDEDSFVRDVKFILEAESGVPVGQQELVFENKVLGDGVTLQQAGVSGDAMLLMRKKSAPSQQSQQPQRQPQQTPQQQQAAPADAASVMQQIRNDPALMERLAQNNPELLEAALNNNTAVFQRLMDEQRAHQQEVQRREQYESMLASADPFDPRAQAQIAEYIRQKNVEDNFANAIEHNPEAFARVTMLYINCSVNGVALKAFVDSGAQSTIMNEKCAKLCNIYHLLDTRFQGVAQGVGTARILGRVHMADLVIGGSHFVSSFTIMESQPGAQDLDFLLGLDNLKRHQASIDLKENVLRIGTESCPFLPEREIPGHSDALRRSVDGLVVESPGPNDNAQGIPQQQQQPRPAQPPQQQQQQQQQQPSGAQRPPQAQQPRPQQRPVQQQQQQFPEATVQSVMNLTGVSRAEVLQALARCGGNADAAVQLLTGFF